MNPGSPERAPTQRCPRCLQELQGPYHPACNEINWVAAPLPAEGVRPTDYNFEPSLDIDRDQQCHAPMCTNAAHIGLYCDRPKGHSGEHSKTIQSLAWPPKPQPDWRKMCIVEIAAENQSVAEYVEHWEGRALKAEKALAEACGSTPECVPQKEYNRLGRTGDLNDKELEEITDMINEGACWYAPTEKAAPECVSAPMPERRICDACGAGVELVSNGLYRCLSCATCYTLKGFLQLRAAPAVESAPPYSTQTMCSADIGKFAPVINDIGAVESAPSAEALLTRIWDDWEYFERTNSPAWNPSVRLFDDVKEWALRRASTKEPE